jgi:hypothetical protein
LDVPVLLDDFALVITYEEFSRWRVEMSIDKKLSTSLQNMYDVFRLVCVYELCDSGNSSSEQIIPAMKGLFPSRSALSLLPSELQLQGSNALSRACELGVVPSDADQDFLGRVIPIFTCNAHRFGPSGASCALFLQVAAAFNHSCDPNCTTTIEAGPAGTPVMLITTLRPVSAGEELAISYLALLQPGETGL